MTRSTSLLPAAERVAAFQTSWGIGWRRSAAPAARALGRPKVPLNSNPAAVSEMATASPLPWGTADHWINGARMPRGQTVFS